MSHYQYSDFEDSDELVELPHVRNLPSRRENRNALPARKVRTSSSEAPPPPPADRQESFDFTYTASRHEREWLVSSLGGFYDQHWLDDVLRLVQGGKEANVYQCLANPSVAGMEQPFVATKV